MNAFDVFLAGECTSSDAPFLEDETGAVYSYSELEMRTANIAGLLLGLGLKPGDRVAAQIEKSPEAVFLYLGILRAGLCYLPLNTAYPAAELEYYLSDAKPRLFIAASKVLSGLAHVLDAAGVAFRLSWEDAQTGRFFSLLERAQPLKRPVLIGADELALIIYTSGTTGQPKGAMITHQNLTSNAQSLQRIWEFTSDDILIHALPLFHVHGLFVALHPVLLAKAKLLFFRKFDAKTVVLAMRRASVLMGVPTFYTRLLGEPSLDVAACQPMRLFISGSAPLLPETFENFIARTGHTILERYGMTEAGMITSNPYTGSRRMGSVGKPLPGVTVRVVDPLSGCELGAGIPGEVQIRGPNVFLGYFGRPTQTQAEFTADGFFKTGDTGQWDLEGYLNLVGRSKDLIISGGYNVYPKEVETALDARPEVLESAVIGIPDSDLGEAVIAVVVLTSGATLDEHALLLQLKKTLAGYKVPKRIHSVAELPRNVMGKVQKNILRIQFNLPT